MSSQASKDDAVVDVGIAHAADALTDNPIYLEELPPLDEAPAHSRHLHTLFHSASMVEIEETQAASASAPTIELPKSSRSLSFKDIDEVTGVDSISPKRLGMKRISTFKTKVEMLPWYIVMPSNPWRRAWDFFVALLVVYISWVVPFSAGFGDLPSSVEHFNTGLDLAFAIDMALNFLTAFVENGMLIGTPWSIAVRYFKSWFVIDLVATIPFELFFSDSSVNTQTSQKGIKISKLLKFPRLFRLISASSIFDETGRSFFYGKIFVGFSFLSHWAACIWYSVVVTGDDYTPLITYAPYLVNGTAADRYFFTLHEAATMLLGNSPSPPQNWAVSLTNYCIMTCGILVTATVICLLAAQFSVSKATFSVFRQNLDDLQDDMTEIGINDRILDHVEKHQMYAWHRRRNIELSKLTKDKSISLPIRTRIVRHLMSDLLQHNELIQELIALNPACVDLVLLKLEPYLFLTGDVVQHKGAVGDCMYFVVDGSLISDDAEEFESGAHFGLPGLLRLPYDTSVTAQSDVQLQMLSVQSFREVCARYPEVMDVVCRNCGVDASIASALRSKPIAPPQSVIRLRARRAAARQQIKKDV